MDAYVECAGEIIKASREQMYENTYLKYGKVVPEELGGGGAGMKRFSQVMNN